MSLTAGVRLGPYEIVSPLGAGGMGEVYRARDTKLNRDVAIKILPDAFASDADRVARFTREAQTLATLNHPHIAQIYGLEQSSTTSALVMELVEGEDLAQRIARGPIPLDDALAIAKQIAEALEAAHEQGIVHRDLKPANIKIRPDGTVKVLDFGLARMTEAAGSGLSRPDADPMNSPTSAALMTGMGVILGTAAYMAPEQARGKPVDRRADVWAFGCVLYECLTGNKAFGGDTMSDSIAAILGREADLGQLPANTPPAVRRLLRRCLAKDAARRLRDVGDARLELEEALAARPEEVMARRTSRWWAWLAAGLCLGAAATGVALGPWNPAPSRPAMRFTPVTNFAGLEIQPALSPDGRSVVFASDRGGQWDLSVSLVSGGSLVRITNDRELEASPRWSPDGAKVAYGRLNEAGLWDIWVVPALGGVPRKVIENATEPAWSPDGRSLAYANVLTSTVWIAEASGANPRELTRSEPTIRHRQPSFSHSGRELAFARRIGGPYGEIAVADVSTGTVRALTAGGGLALSPAWSNGDRFVYFASSRGGTVNIWRVAAPGGTPEQVTAGQGDDAELDVSADGSRLVFSTYRSNASIAELALDAPPGREHLKWLTSDAARGELAPAYSPDGSRIAYFTNQKGAELETIWVMNADGSAPTQVVEADRQSIFPRWTGDGKSLVYAAALNRLPAVEGAVRSVSAAGGVPRDLRVSAVANSSQVDVASDGRLVYLNQKGQIETFDPASQRVETFPAPPGLDPTSLRWLAEGRAFSYRVALRAHDDPNGGLWVRGRGEEPRQLFRGWVAFQAVVGDEIFFIEGKPDLSAPLWRVRPGGAPERTKTVLRLLQWYWIVPDPPRFDVHPDRRRIALQTFEWHEADIGMIEIGAQPR
jgi:serine/threonine protein kinase